MYYNPFIENAQVIGDGYIGRHEIINDIKTILSKNSKDGGIVVSGLTRIGKTSLVKKCIWEARRDGLLEANNIIAIQLTLSTISNFSLFLKQMMDKLYVELKKNEYITDELTYFFDDFKESSKAESEFRIYEQDRCVIDILTSLNEAGIKLIVFLDEFDDATRAFEFPGETVSTNFQKFREYASATEFNVTFILTSRTDISTIDASLPSGSNLRGVFSEKVLVGLTNDEQTEFFDKIQECGLELSQHQKQQILWYAGRSPFLFAKLACGLINRKNNTPNAEIIIEDIFKGYKKDFDKYFDSMISFMKREKQYSKFVQLFFGPVFELTDEDIERLIEYGYVYHDATRVDFKDIGLIGDSDEELDNSFTYQTLSEYCIEYIRMRANQDNSLIIWAELIDAERKLREIIEAEFTREFGSGHWKNQLKTLALSRERGFLYNVTQADNFINSSKRNFGDRVDENPLTVINFKSLGNIISAFWDDMFEDIFKPPYNQIEGLIKEISELNRARNPLAHGTPEQLTFDEKETVSEYCKRISGIRRRT